MRKLPFFVLLASALFLSACSSGGSDSPSDSDAHPQSWFSTHEEDALADPGYDDCTACHASDLLGSGDAVSCYSCHSYNTAPPFSFHPSNWANTYSDHRAFAAANGFATCASCHDHDLRGREPVPSCYSTSFDGGSCHAEGPSDVPHPLDGSYREGEGETGHGQDAKDDLTVCQACHGQLGGPGSNPRFNIGFGDNACEDCHGTDYAHPQSWSGHNTAGNIQNSCTLCHGVNLDGVGGVRPLNCHDCHNENPGLYPSGCVSCHNIPPDSEAPVGGLTPNLPGQHGRVGHANLISSAPIATCDRCHSGAGSGTDRHFDTTPPAEVTLPFDPQDTIVPTSDASNTTCTGICHMEGDFGIIDYPHFGEKWY